MISIRAGRVDEDERHRNGCLATIVTGLTSSVLKLRGLDPQSPDAQEGVVAFRYLSQPQQRKYGQNHDDQSN